jgi:hypothetical protein
MVWGERKRIEAFPRRAPRDRVDALAAQVIEVLDFTLPRTRHRRETALMTLADGARRHYAQLCQAELKQELRSPLIDSLLERRVPMLLRLAMAFALTDPAVAHPSGSHRCSDSLGQVRERLGWLCSSGHGPGAVSPCRATTFA